MKHPTFTEAATEQRVDELYREQDGPKFLYWAAFMVGSYVGLAVLGALVCWVFHYFSGEKPAVTEMDPQTGFTKVVRAYDESGSKF